MDAFFRNIESSSYDKIKTCHFKYNVPSSLAFGSHFCVFKQKCGILGYNNAYECISSYLN